MRLNGIYRRIARCTLGDGCTITFWEDLWLDSMLAVQYPRLFSYAKNKTISVHGMMLEEDLSEVFMLPLSTQAHDELLHLQDRLVQLQYDDTAVDAWTMIWGDKYSSHRFYSYAFSWVETHPYYKVLWKSQSTPVSNS